MIQPYNIVESSTTIDGGLIDTGTVRATSLYSGLLDAYKVNTTHLDATSILGTHLSVGPRYLFRTTSGGTPMVINSDGSLSLPASGLNANDNRWVADADRSYSATQLVKTYALTITGHASTFWGIAFNLASPFATSGQTGILVASDGTTLYIYRMLGVGNNPLVTSIAHTPKTIERMVIQHYANSTTPRMRVFMDGVEQFAGLLTDTLLGVSGGQQGGCAGLILSTGASKVSDLIIGSQPTVLEDGAITTRHIQSNSIYANQVVISDLVGGINAGATTINGGKITTNTITADQLTSGSVTAAKLESDLALVNTLRSSNYDGTSSLMASLGFKLSGTPFTAKKADGSTLSVTADFSSACLIAGYEALTLANCSIGGYQEWTSEGSYSWTCPPGVTRVKELIMIGGGGGGAAGTAGSFGGGGGAAGDTVIITDCPVTPGTSYTIVVGAGGTGGATSGAIGGNGVTSSSGSMVAAGGWANGGSGAPSTGDGGGAYPGNRGNPGGAGGWGTTIVQLHREQYVGGSGGGASNVTGAAGGAGGGCSQVALTGGATLQFGQGGVGSTSGLASYYTGGGGGGSYSQIGGAGGKTTAGSSPSSTGYGGGGGGGGATAAAGYAGANGRCGYVSIRW